MLFLSPKIRALEPAGSREAPVAWFQAKEQVRAFLFWEVSNVVHLPCGNSFFHRGGRSVAQKFYDFRHGGCGLCGDPVIVSGTGPADEKKAAGRHSKKQCPFLFMRGGRP